MNTVKIILTFVMTLSLLILVACSNRNVPSNSATPSSSNEPSSQSKSPSQSSEPEYRITIEEAEQMLSEYLVEYHGFVIGDDYLEDGHESPVFDTDCYVFTSRFGQQSEGIQDRLEGFYAISVDASRFFYYDWGECVWFENGIEIPGQQQTPEESGNYQGLTKEEWDDLQKQKSEYEAISDDEKQTYLMTNEIICEEFIHLGWEHYIDNTLIHHVGGEQFDSWITEQQAMGKCTDIYSFADYFSIDFETMTSLIRDKNLDEVYPIDKVEARYNFMIKEAK